MVNVAAGCRFYPFIELGWLFHGYSSITIITNNMVIMVTMVIRLVGHSCSTGLGLPSCLSSPSSTRGSDVNHGCLVVGPHQQSMNPVS